MHTKTTPWNSNSTAQDLSLKRKRLFERQKVISMRSAVWKRHAKRERQREREKRGKKNGTGSRGRFNELRQTKRGEKRGQRRGREREARTPLVHIYIHTCLHEKRIQGGFEKSVCKRGIACTQHRRQEWGGEGGEGRGSTRRNGILLHGAR